MFFQIGDRQIGVTLLHNGVAVPIDVTGTEIVPKGSANKLSLEVVLPDGLVAFKVIDREKNVRRIAPELNTELVEVLLHTGYTADKLWVTFYPNNHFRLLDLIGNALKLWEVSLIRQGAKFFLVAQVVYTVEVFRGEGGKVVCPVFEQADHGWPQLIELLNHCYADVELPVLLKDYEVPEIERPTITEKNVGWVQWYNYASGVGVVQTYEGPARVHWSSINKPDGGFAGLKTGQMIKFTTITPNGGNSTIKHQVYDVSPI